MYTKIKQYIFLRVSVYKYIQDFIVTLFLVGKSGEKEPAIGDGNIYGSSMLCNTGLACSGCYDKIPQTG